MEALAIGHCPLEVHHVLICVNVLLTKHLFILAKVAFLESCFSFLVQTYHSQVLTLAIELFKVFIGGLMIISITLILFLPSEQSICVMLTQFYSVGVRPGIILERREGAQLRLNQDLRESLIILMVQRELTLICSE